MNQDDTPRVTKSSRDHGELRRRFESWLREQLGDDANPVITSFEAPESNGMSSETILVSAVWDSPDGRGDHDLVVRIAPPSDSMPVFSRYDLSLQYDVMALVGERTDVPIPRLLWNEPSPEPLGAPSFVMGRSVGDVPPDLMPYTFGSWVSEATDSDRERMERTTVDVLTKVAAIADPQVSVPSLAPEPDDGRSALRCHVDAARAWLDWSVGDEASPLLDRCFEWLESNWPSDEGETVLSWGDARIGNIMYRDFEPVAVLDWEMAALGPRELDLAWLIFLHRFFDDIAVQMGLQAMPDFLRRDRMESLYEELSGHRPQNMDWYLMYSAVRHGIVFTRISRRMAHFGDQEMPEDPDDAILHRAALEAMVEGTYWS